jgi:hypothetical protein
MKKIFLVNRFLDAKQKDRTHEEDICPPLVHVSENGLGMATFPDLDLKPDPELVAQGWERRFMADTYRADEATHIYEELGFEVRRESVKPEEFNAICGECDFTACKNYMTIYTRKPSR